MMFTKRTLARFAKRDVRTIQRLIDAKKLIPAALLVESKERAIQLFNEKTAKSFLDGKIV